MEYKYPSLKEHYCNGCSNCVLVTKNNCYEYIWLYATAYPTTESYSNIIHKECDLCSCLCTILCCAPKSICLIPGCPFCVFCPTVCDKKN